jgi:hypothetical protein
MDSACHRLSRVPQKFTPGRAIQNEKQDLYAVGYFKCNPDRKDTTAPERKLVTYEERLNGDLSSSERFVLLVQQKVARYIVYGETSAEALRSHAAIGSYYNQNNRPESALRHLTRARQLEETNKVDPVESLQIALDMSESYLAMKTTGKCQAAQNVNQASQTISPHELTEVSDPRLGYRRDLVLAHIASLRGNHSKAVAHSRVAWGALDEFGGTESEEGAVLSAELTEHHRVPQNSRRELPTRPQDIHKHRDGGAGEAARSCRLEPKRTSIPIAPRTPTGRETTEGIRQQARTGT